MNLTITKIALDKALSLRRRLNHPDDWALSIGLSGGVLLQKIEWAIWLYMFRFRYNF